MQVHRRLRRREPLTSAHFERWVALRSDTVDARHAGPLAEQAKAHAGRIAAAMLRNMPAAQPAPGQAQELRVVPVGQVVRRS
jgi:transcription elongation GreA/GreB family factor